jgi:sulfopyruvate decarboxylase alpha subunit
MKTITFMSLLEEEGFNFFTGVPCSYLAPLCHILSEKDPSFHVPAVREDIALGVAVGAHLAGKLPVLYMQNSGLGYCLEAFTSLHMIYKIPTLTLISYRGPEDPGIEEHAIMGAHTEELLSIFNLKYSILNKNVEAHQIEKTIEEIREYILQENSPYFLLISKGALT